MLKAILTQYIVSPIKIKDTELRSIIKNTCFSLLNFNEFINQDEIYKIVDEQFEIYRKMIKDKFDEIYLRRNVVYF